ncbi:Retrovirus-related Pol polyprotein from transposon TNT 1-94 [Vitis vinifera]|uniref:Retrovirus-related Pol polyprotein from transposon TNT 1-94 n=1 Tax=Vitis vinifera TaxID=29760 RepID=A0A438EMU3_VITVI|nr:Retrovirus-related Pol polyprotein from transposon TNT 1-94 [Vitis vinifera]
MSSSTQSSEHQLSSPSTHNSASLLSLNHALPIKLDRNNYILWKTRMENVVYANGFEEYIEGTKSCPPKELPTGDLNPDFVQWRRFDRMVLSWMYSTLNPDIMGQIVGFQTSHEAWMALHKIFSASSKARIMQLRLEFHTTKKGGDSMLDYILKMKTISDNLTAVGEPVKDRDHILQLLGGLGPDYNSIVASLTAREDDLSLHSVHNILLTHEQRLHLQHSSPTDLPFASAHMASIPSRPHQPRHYHHPSRPQHQVSSSSNRPPTRFHPQQPRNHHPIPSAHNKPHHLSTRPQCQLCGKFGHTASFSHAMLAAAPDHQDSWFFDTGATHHLSHSAQTLSCVQPYSGTDQVTIGDGNSLPILHTGTKTFFFPSKTFSLNQVLHVPHLSTNLINVSKFCTDNDVFFEFHSSYFFVKDQVTKKILLKGWLRDGLYEFSSSSPPHAFVTTSSFSDGAIWHSRLGHLATPILSKALASCNPSVTLQINKIAPCIICPLAKSHSLPYSLSSSHASHPLALIHTDLWGLAPSIFITGARYFLIFIDDYSKHTWIYFLSTKDQALHSFITFRKMFSCPHTPQQNGIAERKIRHLVETGLTLMAQSFLPSKYWTYAFQTAVYLINLLPAKLLHFQSPIQALFHKLPNYHHLQVFDCLCFPSLRPYTQHKLCYRSTACVFLGYAPAHKGYLCLDVSTSRIYISRNVIFHESSFPFQSSSPPPSPPPHLPSSTPALINSPSLSAPSSPAVSSPIITSDSILPLIPVPFATFSLAAPSPPPLPLNTHPMAMNHEYQALLRNNTWSLVPPPSSAHIVGYRWIYKLKYHPDGSIDRHKARLVAQVSFQWLVHQLDVENAFLNGDLEEEVFMTQHQGFVNPTYPTYVCKLHKALYGLNQAPRAWFQKLRIALLDYGFQSSRADTSLFIFHTASDILILLVYVDDILVTGSSPTLVSHFISYLSAKFAFRDLGPLSYFLGIQAHQLGSVLHLTQHKYIADLLKCTQMEASKPAPTPGRLGRTISQSDGVSLSDPLEYRRTVGALQYVTLTRPNIAFAVNKACQFMAKPSDVHWMAVKRILRYLKGTIHLGLHFQPAASMELQGYSDADWASCPDDRRSTSGYCVFLGSNLISWSSSKQRLVSKSSAESEYRGLVSLTAELVWIQSLLQELCLPTSPPILWCDNQSAAHLAANPVFHSRSKHIKLDLHFIREKVLRQELQICYVPSDDQLADIFTKHLPITQFCNLRSKLTVTYPPLSLRGDDNQTDSTLTASHTVVTEQPCNLSKPTLTNHLT